MADIRIAGESARFSEMFVKRAIVVRPRLDDLLKTQDHQESVSAFLEKRAPTYSGT